MRYALPYDPEILYHNGDVVVGAGDNPYILLFGCWRRRGLPRPEHRTPDPILEDAWDES